LPWFRFLKKSERAAAETAATEASPPAEAPTPPDANGDAAPPGAATTEGERRRRRRGSRGGRNRKRRPAGPSQAQDGRDGAKADEPQTDRPETRERPAKTEQRRAEKKPDSERSSGRKGSSRGGGRRKQAPKRAPLPAAKREVVISVDAGEQRVAILEDDRVAEVYLERPERRSIAGNIYHGTVDNVLPGMEAAFVEIGLEKNGFLYVDEIVAPELEGKAREGKRITDLIQRGQDILVQAVKDPMKTKGARLTTEISLPGRFLVYVPYGEGLGVSLGEGAELYAKFFEEPGVSEASGFAVDVRCYTFARQRAKVVRLGCLDAALARGLNDGQREGVFTASLDGGCDAQQCRFVRVDRDEGRDPRFTLGERSRLVDD
jgi:hypothetical protein